MTDVHSQTAGDAGAVAFAVIGTADGVFSLFLLYNQ
ncbi:putative membrane protein, partial [Parabacteroides distasonis str. 3999B T(B) 6]